MINRNENINKFTKSTLIFIGGVLVALLFLRQCNKIDNLKQEVINTEKIANRNYNNLLAAQDSINTYITENGELVSQIRSFEFDVNDIELENKELREKYRGVLRENGELEKINTLISTSLSIKDSIINSSSSVEQDSTGITVNFVDDKKWDKYNWRTFNGSLKLGKIDSTYSIINSRFDFNQGISLQTAIVKDSGRSMLKITTQYPGVAFTNIENINIVNDRLNKKYQKTGGFSIGFGVGYGINLNNNQVISTGPSIGVGLFYSPRWLRF